MSSQVVPINPEGAEGAEGAGGLREEVRAEMRAFGLSHAQAAREIGEGVSTSTLSRWLGGTYPGDVPAVEARIWRWLGTRRERARTALGNVGLDRHADTAAAGEIDGVLAYAQGEGDVVLIHGPSGRGKTWTVKRYCAGHSGAIYLSATGATVTLAGMLSRLADAVGAGPEHGSALAAETAIVARLTDRGALLVVDEAHHLSARLLDELRCIRDLAGCGLALVGDDSVRMTLARCPQVLGRIGMRVSLAAIDADDVAAIAEGPLGRRPRGAELKTLAAIARGPGGLHALRRLFTRAWMLARAEERAAIDAADIALAAEAAA